MFSQEKIQAIKKLDREWSALQKARKLSTDIDVNIVLDKRIDELGKKLFRLATVK